MRLLIIGNIIDKDPLSGAGNNMVSKSRLIKGVFLATAGLLLSTFCSFDSDSPLAAQARSRHSKKHSTGKASAGKTSRHKQHHVAAKTRYAYPLDFFMMHPPEFDRTPLDSVAAKHVKNAFACGIADDLPAPQLVQAGVFQNHSLSGGIFRRRESVKYIILHSTETGVPVPAKNVINAWNSMGRRHPGAQFVVERDGTIYMALDPDLGAVHVNIFKTLPGINNDNSVGIEMNHTGRQDYPLEQRAAVVRLVTYLQHRFNITSDNVITHRYAQQGDHTDPVHFDLEGFLASKEDFRLKALAMRRPAAPRFIEEETEADMPLASVYVQIHGPIKLPRVIQSKASVPSTLAQKFVSTALGPQLAPDVLREP